MLYTTMASASISVETILGLLIYYITTVFWCGALTERRGNYGELTYPLPGVVYGQ